PMVRPSGPVGEGRRLRSGRWPPAMLGTILAVASGAGCGGSPAASPDRAPRARPDRGPWFVDRAPEYRLDVVTRCGGPEKRSVVESVGTGLALFDYDGDGDLDLFVAATSQVRDGAVRPAAGPWLFRNEGPGRWADVTATSGLAYTGWSQAVAV